ncbi:Wadjet anti-phage system protein JetD domain-containing protein [Micromonospora inaquosa]|uniref:Wadjet protein JetD C-terminal domain-containing protein n=1 Tax=Micromonospora inaquosa TaxID=2203716 RepID=A0A3N9WXP5_9ACTN|nr:Wadjet anti-phage system protein JetD domain-containing protein [Micromonospora inaquosa]RQX05611.1 hypothetical protein DLJ59_07110 [Micromonospora inaquosa]
MTDSDGTIPGEPDPEITLSWIRDYPGLVAYAPLPPSGRYPRDSRGRPRPRSARLRTAEPSEAPRRPDGLLSDSDWSWVIRSEHSWAGVSSRLGTDALRIMLELAEAGCVTIGYTLNGNALAQPPRRVYPHPDLTAAEQDRRSRRRDDTTTLRTRAEQIASEIADDWPDASRALRNTEHPNRLLWALRAATDLAEGRTHDSLRAFVQSHANDTKARDDVHHLLAAMGFDHETLIALGVARNPYIGLGGPILLHTTDGSVLDLSAMPGPHDIRLSPRMLPRVTVTGPGDVLLVVENRQAAEAVCDARADLPVVWCHGQPPDAVVSMIVQAVQQTSRVVICADADLGGVRITARIHDNLPSDTTIHIVDVGTVLHDEGRPFNSHSRSRLQQLAQRPDEVGAFAQRCLHRGYALEQEASARAALQAVLNSNLSG